MFAFESVAMAMISIMLPLRLCCSLTGGGAVLLLITFVEIDAMRLEVDFGKKCKKVEAQLYVRAFPTKKCFGRNPITEYCMEI